MRWSGIYKEPVPGRALFSVYDKTGVAEMATALQGEGWEILASGGTAQALSEAGTSVGLLADYTGMPAILDHRVVTLHPKVHGGILFDRNNPSHAEEMESHGIVPIDLVVANLYPFSSEPGAQMIDIGGPALLRAAAKNYAYTAVVVDPADYPLVVSEIRSQGQVSVPTRYRLARTAFAYTAAYDTSITSWFDSDGESREVMPPTIHLALERVDTLRYGENPHQEGARYRLWGESDWLQEAVQHGGPQPSYLNLFDAAAARELVGGLGGGPAAVVVKHANPCGAAQASTPAEALSLAYQCDPRSSFGGVVALNCRIDHKCAEVMESAPQADMVVAPDFEPGVAERLVKHRRNTRIIQAPINPINKESLGISLRDVAGVWLAQEPDVDDDPIDWRAVTERAPSDEEMKDAVFAWRVCARVSSNSVVIAKDQVAWGIGSGQPDRVGAAEMAVVKAEGRAAGGACASDGFFPFPDGIEAAASAGVSVVVQPGGSVNDEQVIARADQLGLSMLFTGRRRFLHR